MLEKLLCSIEEASPSITQAASGHQEVTPDLEEFVYNFYSGYPNCKDFISDFYTITRNNGNNMDEVANDAVLIIAEQQDSCSSRHVVTSSPRPKCKPEVVVDVTQGASTHHGSRGSSGFHSSKNRSSFWSFNFERKSVIASASDSLSSTLYGYH